MQAIIDTGRLLIAAKQVLAYGEFQTLFQGDERLPFSWSTANKLMAIAKDSRIADSDHGPNLPVSWRTLYELTRLDDDTFDSAIDEGAIRADMQRREITRLRSRPKQHYQESTLAFPAEADDSRFDDSYSEIRQGVRFEMRCGDCMEHLAQLEAESVDVVVTSPPYNIGVRYLSYDDARPRSEYLQELNRWADEISRILKADGSLFLNLGAKPTDPWGPLQAAATVAGASAIDELDSTERFQLQNIFHWIKSISIDAADESGCTLSFGHYQPINSAVHTHVNQEYVFHFSKHGNVWLDRLALGVPYQDKSNLQRWEGARDDVRCRGNCWFIPYETIQNRSEDRPHPAPFPVKLAEWCIRSHGLRPGLVVLDPFAGIGSTGVACVRLNVSFLGFELAPEYCAEAIKRMQIALGS